MNDIDKCTDIISFFFCKIKCYEEFWWTVFFKVVQKRQNYDKKLYLKFARIESSRKNYLFYSCFLLFEDLTEQYCLHSDSGNFIPYCIIKIYTINVIKNMVGIILHWLIISTLHLQQSNIIVKYVTMVWFYIKISTHFNNFNSTHYLEVIS